GALRRLPCQKTARSSPLGAPSGRGRNIWAAVFRRQAGKRPAPLSAVQIFLVLQVVPGVLHVVVIVQGVQQLGHVGHLVGVGQDGGGGGDHRHVGRDERIALLLQSVAHSAECFRRGGDLGSVLTGVKILGAGVQSVHHGLVGVLVLQIQR